MIYLGFAWAAYDARAPRNSLHYHGSLLEAARDAVIAHQDTFWIPPHEATSHRRGENHGATTSNPFFYSDGKMIEPDPDEIIHVPARRGELQADDHGEVWAISDDGSDIFVSELELADTTIETPTWQWSEWALPNE